MCAIVVRGRLLSKNGLAMMRTAVRRFEPAVILRNLRVLGLTCPSSNADREQDKCIYRTGKYIQDLFLRDHRLIAGQLGSMLAPQQPRGPTKSENRKRVVQL